MQLPDVNLDALPDLATRQLAAQLLNLIEAQAAEIAALRVENQQLRDELARLKGGSGKPTITPPVQSPADHSSEAERQTRTPRGKPTKNVTLTVTREERCVVDPATLPAGARFNGTRETIVQDLVIQVEVIRFLREEWFVPSSNPTILAPLPSGYHGAFGPTLQALVPALGHDTSNVSPPALLDFLRTMGRSIGTGTLARLLRDSRGRCTEEAEAIHQARLASGPWVATGQTATRVDGQNEVCHAELHGHLTAAGLTLGRQQQQQVWDALAVAAYHAQNAVPSVEWLLSGDATVYDQLSAGHGLCWVHDWRHYAKLRPVLARHQRLVDAYCTDDWALYRALLAYREAPRAEERARLCGAFDRLIDRETGYAALDERIRKTADKRAQLLAVLELPDLPLHNNAMELAARRRVRKRDVRFGPQSRAGARAWGSFQTLAATAAKLGVGLFHELRARLVSPETTPALAERIAARSRLAAHAAG